MKIDNKSPAKGSPTLLQDVMDSTGKHVVGGMVTFNNIHINQETSHVRIDFCYNSIHLFSLEADGTIEEGTGLIITFDSGKMRMSYD